MLHDEVLDIDPGGADVGEEASELAGGVGDQNLHLGVAARGTAVLAGNTRAPGATATHDVCDGAYRSRGDALGPTGSGVLRGVGRRRREGDAVDEQVQVPAHSAQQFHYRSGIAHDDRGPQPRV